MNQNKMLIIHGFVLCVTSTFTSGETYDNATTLRSDLLAGYNTNLVPVLDQSHAITINISLNLYAVLEADTVNGVLKTATSLQCTWYDEKLTWTPSSYGNTDDLLIEQKLVWKPPLALPYSPDVELLGKSWMFVTISSGGLASYQPRNILKTFCTFNMKFWPFDKQVCDIAFIVFGHSENKAQIRIPADGFNTMMLTPNGEWMLEETTTFVRSKSGVSEGVFRVKMKRQYMFYVMTLFLPLVGIGMLNPLVFFLPSESGERVSFSVTILLAITVFLTVISDMLPSDPAVLICILVTIGLISSIFCTLSVIFNLAIYHRSDLVEIGSFYLALVRVTSPKCYRSNQVKTISLPAEETSVGEDDQNLNEKIMYKIKLQEFVTPGKRNTLDKASELADDMQRRTDHENSDVTWKDVSYAIDKILFFVVFLSMAIPVVVFMAYLPITSDYMEP